MIRLLTLLIAFGMIACQQPGDRKTISGDSATLWKAEKKPSGNDVVQQRIERILFKADGSFMMMSLSGEQAGSWHHDASRQQLVLRFPDSHNADTLQITRLDHYRMALLAADSAVIMLKAKR